MIPESGTPGWGPLLALMLGAVKSGTGSFLEKPDRPRPAVHQAASPAYSLRSPHSGAHDP
jgi:hypothetical protein